MPRIEIIRRKIKRAHGAALSKDEEKAVELAFSALSLTDKEGRKTKGGEERKMYFNICAVKVIISIDERRKGEILYRYMNICVYI